MEKAGAPGKSRPSCCGAGWIHSVNREEYSRGEVFSVCRSETHKGSREALFCRASELRSRQMQSMAHYEWIERIGGTEMDPENASYPSKSDKSWSEATPSGPGSHPRDPGRPRGARSPPRGAAGSFAGHSPCSGVARLEGRANAQRTIQC
jgi:hypothetical protein